MQIRLHPESENLEMKSRSSRRWLPRVGSAVSVTRLVVTGAVAVGIATIITTSGSVAPDASASPAQNWQTRLGNGQVASFAEWHETGAPSAIGIRFSADALTSLPTEASDHHHCVDRDGDGVIVHSKECAETREYVIPLPEAVSQREDVPFKWVLLNWNLRGHMPPGIYDVPHFDVHFYMAPIADVFAIRAGPCGPELVDCDDFAAGKMPVPDGLMHPDFSDVDAIAPAMGNHLIDLGGQEFKGEPFTRSWIFGVYEGQVTFYEEMVALAYLQSRPDSCGPIKSPPAVAVSGFYPTQRCVRYDPGANAYTVSMENFVYRAAS
jgi:hypothetical protein